MESVFITAPAPRIVSAAAPPAPPARAAPVAQRCHRPAGALLSMGATAWACGDILIMGLATAAAQAGLVHGAGYAWVARPWLAALAFCAALPAAGFVFGLYDRRTLLSRSAIGVRLGLSVALGVGLGFAILLVLFRAESSRWLGIAAALIYLAVALPLRLVAHEVVTTRRVRLLCVGAGDSVRRLVQILSNVHRRSYEIVGHVRVDSGVARLVAGHVAPDARRGIPRSGPAIPHWLAAARAHWLAAARADIRRSAASAERRPPASARLPEPDLFEDACPCLGSVHEIGNVLTSRPVDEVIVAPELAGSAVVGRAVATCLEHRCRVTDQATFVEKLLGEVPADCITPDWCLKADVQNHVSFETGKRFLDVLAAALGLALTLPLWPLIALAIRIEDCGKAASPGPIFFRQLRVGRHGRCFGILKFRTMRCDAEKDGARWAAARDDRVTRVGRLLRRSRLDELPQLINILRGDMSLVGPRPERPEFVRDLEQLLPHYRLRHLIKPGLTGWAQVHFGYGASVADAHRKLCYDLYYLKHRSLDLDLAILLRTLGTFLLGSR